MKNLSLVFFAVAIVISACGKNSEKTAVEKKFWKNIDGPNNVDCDIYERLSKSDDSPNVTYKSGKSIYSFEGDFGRLTLNSNAGYKYDYYACDSRTRQVARNIVEKDKITRHPEELIEVVNIFGKKHYSTRKTGNIVTTHTPARERVVQIGWEEISRRCPKSFRMYGHPCNYRDLTLSYPQLPFPSPSAPKSSKNNKEIVDQL